MDLTSQLAAMHKTSKEHWDKVLARWKHRLWVLIDWILQDLAPWLKWCIFDALLTAFIAYLAARYKRLQPFFQAIGRLNAAAGRMISAASFALEAQAFAGAWNSCSDSRGTWIWNNSRSPFARALGGGYLAMEGVPQALRAEAADPEEDQDCNIDTEDAAVAPAGKAEFCRFDYHVLFHPSYQVPALYFNAYNAGGELLSLAHMEDHFQRFNLPGSRGANCSWMFVAAEEHPILKRPVNMLHPCRTAEVMQLLLVGSLSTREGSIEKYLAAWFSVFGPAVGLKLPKELWPMANHAALRGFMSVALQD